MTRILVTGSRDWTNLDVVVDGLLAAWLTTGKERHPVLVHGACPHGGADTLAAQIAELWHWDVEAHPADWEHLRRAAGPVRNQEMVDAGADICVAFPLPTSRGTVDCIRRAERAGIPVIQPPFRTVDLWPGHLSASALSDRGQEV